ncbi:hypothetical protein N7492_002504 [Penicillium capsulatum]|uniref:Uncharacterized protein n=1 Tax=Penicillium capsulatum TaxID=69766 RepID=A0A9W9IHZ6_9EURO|nr:hypothetical protein N7492_002504 [Penicillium capsulatum]KAJ6122892.1 hypothetical protein N7512_005357 [Penicillium capsulatum]
MKTATIFSILFGLAASVAIPSPEASDSVFLERRTPSDKSGNSQIALNCHATFEPNQGGVSGEGEGGSAQFNQDLIFVAQGTKITPDACTDVDEGPFCNNCIFSGGGLSSPTNVTGCWNPSGGNKGCSVKFKYNGYDYNTQNKEDVCGHEDSFEPFQSGLSAVCYFDV